MRVRSASGPIRRPSRVKLLFFTAFLVLAPPVLLLIVFESVLRMSGYGHPARFWELHEADGRLYYTPHPDFTRLYFPEPLKRLFVPFRVPVEKAPGEFRVVVLGGSAVNGDPDHNFSIPVILREQLQRARPDNEVVVINAALTACNSFVAREISRDFARLQPDVVVVYMGNNEVVGPFGPANRISSGALGAALPHAQVAVRRTRVGQWFGSLRDARNPPPGDGGWRGMEHFLEQHIEADDPRLESVYRHFQSNLERIVANSRRAGAAVVLCTVAVNQLHQPPFLPMADDFARAEALLAEGNAEGAAQAFALARDKDALRFRADSRINEIIRSVARTEESARGPRIFLADTDRDLRGGDGVLPAGFDSFYEHVHFNLHGAFRVATALAETIHPPEGETADTPLWLNFQELQTVLAYNEYEVWRILADLRQRFAAPPFTLIEDWPERTAWMRELEERFLQSVSLAETKARIYSSFVAALQARPEDALLQFRLARFLAGNHQVEAALPFFRSAYKRYPWDPTLIEGYLRASIHVRNWAGLAEPVDRLRRSAPLHPRLDYFEAAARLCPSRPGNPREPLMAYLARNPGNPEALALRAIVEESTGGP